MSHGDFTESKHNIQNDEVALVFFRKVKEAPSNLCHIGKRVHSLWLVKRRGCLSL